MKVTVLREAGIEEALLGLSLSYNQPVEKMKAVADRLADKNEAHNKFLESIVVWVDVIAPRFWWQEFDTYRVGVTKQSESTIHTIMKTELMPEDFAHPIFQPELDRLNDMILDERFIELKNALPEGFLQRRIVCTNYKTLRRIIFQRKNHKLPEWHTFIQAILTQVEHPEWLPSYGGTK